MNNLWVHLNAHEHALVLRVLNIPSETAQALRSRLIQIKEDQRDAEWFVTRAQGDWNDEGIIEVDDNAMISPSDDGAYVQAWVWVEDDREDDEI